MSGPKAARIHRDTFGDSVEGRIAEIGAQGDGVLSAGAWRLFVPRTVPGDLVRVAAKGERGVLLSLLEPGPDRAAAPCIHYDSCGGCSLQHVTRDFYRNWKKTLAASALAREGLSADIAEMVETPAASRRRAVFAVERARRTVVVGFNAARSSSVSAIGECVVLAPGLRTALPSLAKIAAQFNARKFDLAATLCENGVDIDLRARTLVEPRGVALQALTVAMREAGFIRLSLNGEPIVTLATPAFSFDDVSVSPSPGAFLQASKEAEQVLIELVKEGCASARRIADVFCGCGTFALPLAKTASVSAFDSDASAIAALDAAARSAQASGALHPVRTAERNLIERPLTAEELDVFDAVVFDPPRAGAKSQSEELAKSRVKRVVAVSCNPKTFARDLAILSQGGFKLERVMPIDQFVFTPHIELVGFLRR
jgi:23S rRNA (uracil1939-C5)-methyltransferase